MKKMAKPIFFAGVYLSILLWGAAAWADDAASAFMRDPANTGMSKNAIAIEAQKKLSSMGAEQIEKLDEILAFGLTAYYDHDYARALEIFKALSETVVTLDLLFWIGRCARETGDLELAVGSFQTMLFADPGLPRVRLELAAVYLKQQRYGEARGLLEQVLATDPPPAVRRNVERMLVQIENRARRTRWRLHASQLYMWDDNINASTAQRELDVAGGTLNLDATSRQLGARALVTRAFGDLTHYLGDQKRWRWNTSAGFANTYYPDFTQFDLLTGTVKTGPAQVGRRYHLTLPVGYTETMYGRERLSRTFLVEPAYRYAVSSHFSVSGLVKYAVTEYVETRFQGLDNTKARIELAPIFNWGTGGQRLRLSTGYERADADESKYSYHGYFAGLNYSRKLPARLEILFGYQWLHRNYNDGKALPLYDDYRRDHRHAVYVGMKQSWGKRFFGLVSYAYTRNDSNLGLYTYDRQTVSAGVGVEF